MAYSLFLNSNPQPQTSNFSAVPVPRYQLPAISYTLFNNDALHGLTSLLAAETRGEGSCEKIILPSIILRTNSPLKAIRIFG
jgi:hypothetical protein